MKLVFLKKEKMMLEINSFLHFGLQVTLLASVVKPLNFVRLPSSRANFGNIHHSWPERDLNLVLYFAKFLLNNWTWRVMFNITCLFFFCYYLRKISSLKYFNCLKFHYKIITCNIISSMCTIVIYNKWFVCGQEIDAI